MTTHDQLIRSPGGFGPGYTAITAAGEAAADVGFDFGILRLRAGELHELPRGRERAALLMHGEVEVLYAVEGSLARASKSLIGRLFGWIVP